MLTEQPNWLMQRAQLTPERIALIYEDQTVTFAELFAASKRMAEQLAAHSVRKGDTAAILLQNRAEMVYAVHACFLLGVKAVLLNTKLSTHERLFQLEDSGSGFLLTDSSCLLILFYETGSKRLLRIGRISLCFHLSRGWLKIFGTGYDRAVCGTIRLGLRTV